MISEKGKEVKRIYKKEEYGMLVGRAQSGDERALEEIIEALTPYIMNLCSAYYIAGLEKDDLVQLGYITLFKAVNAYKGTKAGAFAYLVAAVRKNLFYEIRNRNYKPIDLSYETTMESGHESEELFIEEECIEDTMLQQKRLQALHWALPKLTEEEKELIKVLFYWGERVTDYARKKGISVSLCNKMKKSTLNKLKKLIEERIRERSKF